ncbi:MAG TPA: PEP-CTERM sorting domain-containing protein [Verrucomicrobiae bacterium]|nr:PEP-CTERM sorting domain-containing protein [Verrucomicrobiae bacterium]
MNRIVLLLLGMITLCATSGPAQQLLSSGDTFTYNFLNLQNFGDGYASSNPRGFTTFYIDPAQSTPGATYRVELFENNTGEAPIGTVNGTGNVTANSVNAWQDLNGAVRVTVTSGNVYFQNVAVNVYRPTGLGDYELYSSGLVPVPEPGTLSLVGLGAAGLLGWTLRRRRG